MIITDTNFWYDLASGAIDENTIKGLPIAVTAITIMELVSTRKLRTVEGRAQVLKVCRIIKAANPVYLRDLPYEFAARYYLGKNIKKRIHLNRFFDVCENGFGQIDYESYVQTRKDANLGFKEDLQNQIKNVRQTPALKDRLKSYESASNSAASDFLQEIGKVLEINSRKVNMKRILEKGKGLELYLRARAEYNRRLTFDKGYLPNGNDMLDLANLLYVTIEDMYLTSDKKWKNIIEEVNYSNKLYSIPITKIVTQPARIEL